MRMTTFRLFMLRLFNTTLGRFEVMSHIMKKMLIFFLIKSKKDNRYVASSRFYEHEDIK